MKAVRNAVLALLAALAACDRPGELAGMEVTRSSLSFEAPGGSGDPAPQVIWVRNSGRGSLARPTTTIEYADAPGWLAATVSGSDAPYEVDVQPTTAGLEPGVYRAAITIDSTNAGNSPSQVGVTLTVPDPRFSLSVSSVALESPRGGGDPLPKTFYVLNGGRGTLPVPEIQISYVGAAGWLSAAVSGTPDLYAVTVWAAVAGLDSGVYSATMSIGASGVDGSPRTLGVTLTIPPAEVALSAHQIRIDGRPDKVDPAPVAITVTNAGGGFLDPPTVTVERELKPAGWNWDCLTATVAGTQAPYTVWLRAHEPVTAVPYPPPPYPENSTCKAVVTVSSPGATVADGVAVEYVLAPPVIEPSSSLVSWSQFSGCPLPAPVAVGVTNAGPLVLARPTATVPPEAAAWLDATVAQDQEPYVVTFTMKERPQMDPFAATTTAVVLTVPGSAPVPITVSYSEISPSGITSTSIAPSQLGIWAQEGAGDPWPRRITLHTEGGCISPPAVGVSYSPPTDPTWISTKIESSVQRHDVIVEASAAGISAGERRSATVHVEASGLTADVPVTLEVGAFAPTGAMNQARYSSVLTPLPDGRVLATGGLGDPITPYAPLWSAEIWDPSTGAWTSTGLMRRGRSRHGATVLEDGKVFVCGGAGGGMICEWTLGETWSLGVTTQAFHDPATLFLLPDGRVLVVGGTPEIIDPATGASTVNRDLSGSVAVELADGRVLLAETYTAKTWIYDPALDLWLPTGDRSGAYQTQLLPLPDGRVLSIGCPSGVAEIWDPQTGLWTPTSPPPSLHCDQNSLTLSNGKVIAIEGYVPDVGTVSDVEMFDPITETWTVVGTLPGTQRAKSSIALTATGMILIAGGEASTGATAETFTW